MSNTGGARLGLCRCCLKIQFSLGLTALVLYLIYRPITPRYYITTFTLPPSNSTSNATFTLQIENKNTERGIYHDDLAVTLSSFPNRTTTAAPAAIIPAFYQGHKKTANKPVSVAWAGNGTSAVLRVGVESKFRYKVWSWKSGRHAVSVAGAVAVDGEGNKIAKDGIRLSSAAVTVGRVVAPLVSVAAVAYWTAGI